MAVKASDLIAKFQFALDNHWGYIWGTAGEMWTAAKQRELEKTTDEDRRSGREYGSKWIGHTVTDCSGLFTWAFRELGGYMYHGSDTMYNRYCVAHGTLSKGKRTDGQTLKPGTAVFCYNAAKKRRSHVGLYIGDGHVIEASGTINGVIMTKITNSKWVEWGELKGVMFDASGGDSVPNNQYDSLPTLRKGSRGEAVQLLQTKLMASGYSVGDSGADGIFGKATQSAVVKFQMDNCLAMDGIVGPRTWEALYAAEVAEKTYTATIQGLTKDQVTALLKAYPTADVTEERG